MRAVGISATTATNGWLPIVRLPLLSAIATPSVPKGLGREGKRVQMGEPVAPPPRVHGLSVTPRTQCKHWDSERDIIAIQHKCCRQYYACIACHEALAGHEAEVWPKSEQSDTKAVLCGNCRHEMTIAAYLACRNACPACAAEFNPGCAKHYDLYFAM